jgi:glycosyltransferase involved in cell wall biosynthesis
MSAMENVEFCIVVPSYNNEEWCVKNLRSIFAQRYPCWELHYIDDASTDDTNSLVHRLIEQHKMQNKCTVQRNNDRRGAAANIYQSICAVSPHKVIILLDGDDWLAHPYVLDRLSQVYKAPDVWLTYGSLVVYPTGKYIGEPLPLEVMENIQFREYPWVTMHLKSFRASLFHKIAYADLLYKGQFLQMSSDVAIMLPMLEMASKGHIRFISEPLYIYNVVNPISDHQLNILQQQRLSSYIRSKPRYKPLENLF